MLKKERFNAKYNTAMGQIPRSIERISSFISFWALYKIPGKLPGCFNLSEWFSTEWRTYYTSNCKKAAPYR